MRVGGNLERTRATGPPSSSSSPRFASDAGKPNMRRACLPSAVFENPIGLRSRAGAKTCRVQARLWRGAKLSRAEPWSALKSSENVEPAEESEGLDVAALSESVNISVSSLPSRNLRELRASTRIDAPAELVWDTLTSYETLHEFIPGLAVNECLERTDSGATLLQIGEANTAVGFRFKAKVKLRITEFPDGLEEGHKFCLDRDQSDGGDEAVRDITFSQLEGDFKQYEGTWKIVGNDSGSVCDLVYILRVKPQPWLPVSLVMMQVSQEVKTNLACVRREAEMKKGNYEIKTNSQN